MDRSTVSIHILKETLFYVFVKASVAELVDVVDLGSTA